jgi:hypothetical protein
VAAADSDRDAAVGEDGLGGVGCTPGRLGIGRCCERRDAVDWLAWNKVKARSSGMRRVVASVS